jgi:hypothetical protein
LLPKTLQYTLAQKIGIAFTTFRKLDNSLSDYFVDLIGSFHEPKGYSSHFECDAHDARRLAVNPAAV